MMKRSFLLIMTTVIPLILLSLGTKEASGSDKKNKSSPFNGLKGEVKLITLDPGHFHAALVQKNNYDQISAQVFVYAPSGSDLNEHLQRINGYNKRLENPTHWEEQVYTGDDFLDKMLTEKKGNVVVVSGNNKIKSDYILRSVEAGLNVLADKPMVTTSEQFSILEKAFETAKKKGVLLYDIMTERFSVTTLLQRELSQNPKIFGSLQPGTNEQPAIEMISVHYFYKNVSGNILVRPAWFFDVNQQGEGIVDVTTHLVDLVQWECFPDQILKKKDVQIIGAKRWPTTFSKEQFTAVTRLESYPEYLLKDVKDDKLNVYANGEILYKLKGALAKVTAIWDFKAAEGAGDTHYAIMRGSMANLEICQGVEEKFDPTLYVEAAKGIDLIGFATELENAVKALPQIGMKLEKITPSKWKLIIPDQLKIGHEAHFAQVTIKYLEYLKAGKLPEWEVTNMITKYYTTTSALARAKKEK